MSYAFVVSHTQRKLSEFCRSEEYISGSSTRKNCASVYPDLILSTVENALIKAFPLTYQLLDGRDWDALINEFFTAHKTPFPSFWQLPKGLCDFVREQNWKEQLGIPYLEELIDFEWVEIEVYLMPACERQLFRNEGDLMQDFLYVNPEHCFREYAYPVFERSPLPPETPQGEHHLFCFRHPRSKQVHFIALSRFYRSVLDRLIQGECTGKEALQYAADKCLLSLDEKLCMAARSFFQELLSQEAILGFQ